MMKGDYEFDIERLTKKNEILTGDCKILTDELAIARLTISENSCNLEEDYRLLSNELKTVRIQSSMMLQKYNVIKR
jgi:hypothetical protein